MFYNANLLNNSIKKEIAAQEYINNITFIVIGKSTRGKNQKLTNVYNSICESWKIIHGLKFSIPKYQLIHINKKRDMDYTAGVRLKGGYVVQNTTSVINLGITL